MPDPQVDFDALAQRHGGAPVIDYDALARTHGGDASVTQADTAPVTEEGPAPYGVKLPSGRVLILADRSEQQRRAAARFAKNVKTPAQERIFMQTFERPNLLKQATVDEMVGGAKDIARGNVAKGAHRILVGGGTLAAVGFAPQVGSALVATPLATTAQLVGGIAAAEGASKVAKAGAEALGATPDQATLAGDVGGLAGGVGAAKLISEVPAALQNRVEPALRAGALKKVAQALGPTKERYKAMAARLAPEVLKRGLGGSRASLLENAAAQAETAGEAVDAALTQYANRKVGTQPVIDALESAKDAFRTTGRNGAIVEFEPRAIRQLGKLQTVIDQLGDDVTTEKIVAVRRAWDTVVDRAGGFAHRAGGAIGIPLAEQTEAWAKREATGAIRRALASDVPELSAVNKEYHFWEGLRDVLAQTQRRTQPQQPGLGQAAAEATGAMIGSGKGLGSAWVTAKAAKLAHQVFTSPRWRLIDARLRWRLADAIASGSGAQIEGALTSIAAVQKRAPAQLPEGRGAKPEFHLPGDIIQANVVSEPGRLVPAAPMAYDLDATVPAAKAVRVAQYSSDPNATPANIVTPDVRKTLKRMLSDLETFEPQRGRLVAKPELRAGDPFINRPDIPGGAHYVEQTPGSPVGDDIRVISEQNVSNREIRKAILDLLRGKKPTNRLHTAALDAAQGYLEKRPGYRGPSVPDDDAEFAAFSRMVDEAASKETKRR